MSRPSCSPCFASFATRRARAAWARPAAGATWSDTTGIRSGASCAPRCEMRSTPEPREADVAANGASLAQDPPLVIDLDGTLLRSDLLMETCLLFLRDQPLRLLQPLQWLLKGKAALKRQLADSTRL